MSDTAYEYSICSKCGQKWQNIDYACARHQLTCGYPIPPKKAEGVCCTHAAEYAN